MCRALAGLRLPAFDRAYQTAFPGLWQLVHFCAADVSFLDPFRIRVHNWVLSLEAGVVRAERPAPMVGQAFQLLALSHISGHVLGPDHFCWPPCSAVLVLCVHSMPCHDAVRPVSAAERQVPLVRFRSSRPGPSGWKVCFIQALPEWIQASLHARGVPDGRGGSCQRMSAQQSAASLDLPYSSLNRAYAKGVFAAPFVLYLDALVCETPSGTADLSSEFQPITKNS